jgi:hypothetical protein
VSSVDGGTISSGSAGATGAVTGGVEPVSSAASGGGAGGATAASRVDADLSVPAQPAPPSVFVEGEVSQAAGREGSAVLGGGGAGMVESRVGGVGSSGAEQEATAATRSGQGEIRGAGFVAGDAQASASGASTSRLEQAGNLEFSQRDQAVAKSRSVEDAHDQARHVADDPAAVGTERAKLEASSKVGESLPVDPRGVEAQANVATSTVANPRAAAQAQAEGMAATQEREVEVKVGVGTPPAGDEKK